MNSSMYPDNIIGLMFKMLDAAMELANSVVDKLMLSPLDILSGWYDVDAVPKWLQDFLDIVIKWSMPLIADVTLFDLLIGSTLVIVLVIGVVKYFGDVLGL